MHVYFIRHGQTDFNIIHRIQGATVDTPLNKQGKDEITELLNQLPKDIDVVFTSPLKRAATSAKIIADYLNKSLVVKDELIEKDFGSLEGKTWDQVPNGEKIRQSGRDLTYNYHEFGGESVEDVTKRVNRFLDFLKSSDYNSVAIVTSQGIIRLVYKMYFKKLAGRIPNGSILKLDI